MAESPAPVKLCNLQGWRLERVAGEHPGYLISLLCCAGHVHFVAYSPLYAEARSLARAWERETFGEEWSPLRIEDHARGVTIAAGEEALRR